MHTIEISSEQSHNFFTYLCYNREHGKPTANTWYSINLFTGPSDKIKDKCQTHLFPAHDIFEWTWNGNVFTIRHVEEGSPVFDGCHAVDYFKRLTVQHEDLTILKAFVEQAVNYSRQTDDAQLTLYYADCENVYWNQLNDSYAQSMDNIFIDPSVKEQLDSHISSFLAQRNKYNAFGRPYKLNILLHGVPGSGKSSLVKSIAMKYKRPIYVLSFGKDLTDDKMISLVSQMSDNPILLFEDIDAFFVKRDVNNINVSLSCLLNLLDGTFVRSGMICFLTANQANKLDEALLRPSRIDRVIRFNYPKKEHVAAAYASLVSAPGAMSFEDFYKRIEGVKLNMSAIVDYLFRYGDTPDLEKNMNELLNREQELMLEMEQEGIVPEE